ncbi:MAG: protein kinase [Sandaracinaceae bacterium]|nr:protein kinase [Sandaracinaceae bacterium]
MYEVLDRTREAVVALKMMARRDPRDLYQFKREFRSLAELAHPNLAQLYELHSEGDRWFFTMELVDGQDALSYVRNNVDPAAIKRPGRVDETAPTALMTHPHGKAQAPAAPVAVHAEARSPAMFDEARLRRLVEQLADGLCFLHGAGRVHRDLKPSNVMVARGGRAVMLDFGLVAEVAADDDRSVDAISGTPAYMAPEQATGEPVGPAADWYAVGVMLYEALAGRRPFVGTAMELLRQKRETDPRAPSELVEGRPADLDAPVWNSCAVHLRAVRRARRFGHASPAARGCVRSPTALQSTGTGPSSAARRNSGGFAMPSALRARGAPSRRWFTAHRGWARARSSLIFSASCAAARPTSCSSPGAASSRSRCPTRPSTASSTSWRATSSASRGPSSGRFSLAIFATLARPLPGAARRDGGTTLRAAP